MRLHQTNTQTCVISWSGLRSASSDPTSLHKLVSSSLCNSQSHQSRKCLRNVISKSAGLLLMRSFEHTPGCARWSHRWHLYKSVRVQCIGLGGLKKKRKKEKKRLHFPQPAFCTDVSPSETSGCKNSVGCSPRGLISAERLTGKSGYKQNFFSLDWSWCYIFTGFAYVYIHTYIHIYI